MNLISDDMACSHDERYITAFAAISQLVAEKDRLIEEKDELIDSKDRLWRAMHQIIQEKDKELLERFDKTSDFKDLQRSGTEIKELRSGIIRLKRRDEDLETSLREALETESDADEGTDKHELGVSGAAVASESVTSSLAASDKPREKEHTGTSAANVKGTRRKHFPYALQRSRPVSVDTSQLFAGRLVIQSQSCPPISVEVLPMVESRSQINLTFMELEGLATDMFDIIHDTFSRMGSLGNFSNVSSKGSRRCGRSCFLATDTCWTTEQPGCFACR